MLSGTEEEGSAADVVDATSDTLGVIVNEADEAIGKDGVLAASDAEVMFDVASGLFEVEGFEVVANSDALV